MKLLQNSYYLHFLRYLFIHTRPIIFSSLVFVSYNDVILNIHRAIKKVTME